MVSYSRMLQGKPHAWQRHEVVSLLFIYWPHSLFSLRSFCGKFRILYNGTEHKLECALWTTTKLHRPFCFGAVHSAQDDEHHVACKQIHKSPVHKRYTKVFRQCAHHATLVTNMPRRISGFVTVGGKCLLCLFVFLLLVVLFLLRCPPSVKACFIDLNLNCVVQTFAGIKPSRTTVEAGLHVSLWAFIWHLASACNVLISAENVWGCKRAIT